MKTVSLLQSLRGRLFFKYAGYFASVLSAVLVVSTALSLYFSYRDTRTLLDELQFEKAVSAAVRIEEYVRIIETQLRGAVALPLSAGPHDLNAEYIELLKLLQVSPAVSDAAWIDTSGYERIRVSRLAPDIIGAAVDRRGDEDFHAAAGGRAWYSEVYFRRDSEPYIRITVPGTAREHGIATAEVNLKWVGEIVRDIRIGVTGHAYVVDSHGRLISHPDISRVLRGSDLSGTTPVQAAIASLEKRDPPRRTLIGTDNMGMPTLSAHVPIRALGWSVLVEQHLQEAFAPLYEAAVRAVTLIVLGVAAAIACGFMLARHMVAPIRRLQQGAMRIGEGDLDERVMIDTSDELQALAEQFNSMALKLRESYDGLEQKIEERTRQLGEANRAKSRFLAAASHDLRQPVHALGLLIAQLQETHEPAAARRLIDKVAVSSSAVSELLDALLDISKLDAGAIQSEPSSFRLQPLLDRIEHSFGPLALSNDLRLRVRPSPLSVVTDATLLERILINFVANAVRYTKTGGILVGVRRRYERALIEVWDTGVGIPRSEQRRIFEEFYRLASPSDHDFKGIGLGLSIVERLASLLELPLSVTSIPGRGSKFAISVPLAPRVQETKPLTLPAVDFAFEKVQVLLIDDDSAALEAAAGLLSQWGCEVLAWPDGSRLDEMAALTFIPAVIVCDYHLGKEQGTEVIERCRVRMGREIPAVLISGDITASVRELANAKGLHLLQKPLKAAKLRALLQQVLRPVEV